ncbi:DUF2802 domain-containing protein [Salinispirillum marinum]|uniref:DUF2802 domain-containing protein n=2 Tax=Saccharospirillaceae TaxID=255527 RepID=A0ABV8BIK0_9GAMM
MNLADSSLLLWFVAFASLFVVVLLVLWVSAGRRNKQLAEDVSAMRRELSMIQAGNIGLGKKLLAVARQTQHAQAQLRQQTVAPPTVSVPNPVPPKPKDVSKPTAPADDEEDSLAQFDTAQDLLRHGAGIDQVIKQTGLTRSEAELILLLNKPSMR